MGPLVREKETKKKRDWYYAAGFSISQCRKLCKYLFGSFLFDVKKNDIGNEMSFIIYLFKELKQDDGSVIKIEELIDMSDFQEFWCKHGEWKIKYIDTDDVE